MQKSPRYYWWAKVTWSHLCKTIVMRQKGLLTLLTHSENQISGSTLFLMRQQTKGMQNTKFMDRRNFTVRRHVLILILLGNLSSRSHCRISDCSIPLSAEHLQCARHYCNTTPISVTMALLALRTWPVMLVPVINLLAFGYKPIHLYLALWCWKGDKSIFLLHLLAPS